MLVGSHSHNLKPNTNLKVNLTSNPNSDDTLASFRRLFLVTDNWYQKLVSLSYYFGGRLFCCQKPAPD